MIIYFAVKARQMAFTNAAFIFNTYAVNALPVTVAGDGGIGGFWAYRLKRRKLR